MIPRELHSEPDEVWKKIDDIRKFNKIQWHSLSVELTRIRKISAKALSNRFSKKSNDWELIVDILGQLGCKLVLLIPDEEDMQRKRAGMKAKFESYLPFIELYASLGPDDQKLLQDIANRLLLKRWKTI